MTPAKGTRILISVSLVLVMVASPILAAPGLDIRKGPLNPQGVQPNPSFTGPSFDPHAVQGQWFQDANQEYEYRGYEFYDNVEEYFGQSHGGGSQGASAIQGIVTGITWAGGAGISPITAFQILATISNDLPGDISQARPGTNSHGETGSLQDLGWNGTLHFVKLTTEFAVLAGAQPPVGGPYEGAEPYIEALDPDESAWYCWADDPDAPDPAGGFWVPAYDFGHILPGQSAQRTLSFTVPGGLPDTDHRYSEISESFNSQTDVFVNRTTSLKISDWAEDLFTDTRLPYPFLPEGTFASDVSVFFHVPEPSTLLLAILSLLTLIAMSLRRRRRATV